MKISSSFGLLVDIFTCVIAADCVVAGVVCAGVVLIVDVSGSVDCCVTSPLRIVVGGYNAQLQGRVVADKIRNKIKLNYNIMITAYACATLRRIRISLVQWFFPDFAL